MFNYHGWIIIEHQDHFQKMVDGQIDYPEYRSRLLAVTTNLDRIAEDQFDIPKIDLKVMSGTNGIITVHISGERNHYNFGIEKLLDWIKVNAPMSHGLIFCKDDEIEKYENRYWVLRLATSKVTEMDDVYLSPIDQIVENKK